jgi:hypothetical protein
VTIRPAILLTLATMGVGAAALPADIDPAFRVFLTRQMKFSASELNALARGKTVRHSLGATTPGEVAAVGATWIDASPDIFLERFRDIVRFKRDEDVLQIGRFHDPPVIEDLAALTVDEDDLDAEDCRVGDCNVRLPSGDIVRFQREIDWKAPGARAKAAALFKRMLIDHVHAYWSGGAGRMAEYNDDKRPIQPGVEFGGILNNSPYLSELVPGLPDHLRDFPSARLAGSEDFLYWSKEKFGIAPFITVTHITISRAASGAVVITSKDVYSSRYFDASVGLTIVSKSQDGGFVLVYANRSRASALKGSFSALRRAIVDRRVRGSLEQGLKAIKSRLEGVK